MYKSVAQPVVCASMDGINGTVFAYGVTSSGKTYTMMVRPAGGGSGGSDGTARHALRGQ